MNSPLDKRRSCIWVPILLRVCQCIFKIMRLYKSRVHVDSIHLKDSANTSSLVQAKEYAMSLKQRLEESNKIDEAHIFLDFNDNDSTMPSKSGGAASNILSANPTRADEYFQLSP